MKRFALVALLLLGACQSQTPAKVAITTCETYGRTLSALANYKSELSEARILRVGEIIRYVHPFCARDRVLPVDPETQIAYLSPVLTELTQLLFDVRGE